MTPDGCSRSTGGSDGTSSAFVGGNESVAVRGVYDDMTVMKKRMILPMPALRRAKK